MFKLEVEIMTDVIKYFNSVEIYILYVYDALLCEEKDKAVVMETMNRIILKHGVKTCVKDTSAKIDVECAIADEIAENNKAELFVMDTNNKRKAVDEFFKRFRIKCASYVSETSLDICYEMILISLMKYLMSTKPFA